MQFDRTPLIAELVSLEHPVSLDAGAPNQLADDRLRGRDVQQLFAPLTIRNTDAAHACLAGLWLRFDFLVESHALSQEIESIEGSAWHAIMHRREGDFANSKYWWRRVGNLAALEPIGDPFGFVDRVAAYRERGAGDPQELKRMQMLEWESLFQHCYRLAIDQ